LLGDNFLRDAISSMNRLSVERWFDRGRNLVLIEHMIQRMTG
jgi:hypothetical protein